MTRWREGRTVNEKPPRGWTTPVLNPAAKKVNRSFRKVIREFWKAVNDRRIDRLKLLITYSERMVGTDVSYVKRRKPTKMRIKGKCWACQKRKAEHRHHVIQVQHGGPNHPRNFVLICKRCHGEIHPWMLVLEPEPTDEFKWLPR